MALSEQDQRRIISKESAWIDSDQFAPLDLSAFPNLQPPPPADTHDQRFAKDWRDTALSSSASALKQFVENPDVSALERVGSEIGAEDFRDEVRQRRGETIAQQFRQRRPDYWQSEENYRRMVGTLSFNCLPPSQQNGTIEEQLVHLIDGNFWTPDNLVAVYDALDGRGMLDVEPGQPRNLTERERLRVARMAQAGRPDEAIDEYVRCALDGEEASIEMLNDPNYKALFDDAVMMIFEEITLDYVATAQRKRFLLRHCGNRGLSLPLLQEAWRALQANERRYERAEVLKPFQPPTEAPSAKQIDSLDDDAVNDLYHHSLRHYADSIRRAPGIIA